MRGVALSDLHLGFRRYAAQMEGRNAREVDIERAWKRAVENALDASPDLVTVAGDCFHHPRVGTGAEIAFRDGVRRLAEVCPVVVLQGNHDATKTSASRSPIHIPGDYERVHVVDTPQRVRLNAESTGESVAVACFPYVDLSAEEESYRVDPDPEADVNVLALHGAVQASGDAEALPYFYAGDRALDTGREADRWEVICCGDYHEFHRLHPDALAFYSGAIERTSSDVWGETGEKGIVVYDTRAGELELVAHETREHRSWEAPFETGQPPLPGGSGNPMEGFNAILRDMATDEELEGVVARLVVTDFPRGRRQEIDWEAVREIKATCLHFQLDLRWSDRQGAIVRDRREGEGATLQEDALKFFSDDETEVRDCAMSYLGVDATEEKPETPEPQLAAGGVS